MRLSNEELQENMDNNKVLSIELKNEVELATKGELQRVMDALADFAEQDNMENLYEADMDIEELQHSMSRFEARLLWIMKTLLSIAK